MVTKLHQFDAVKTWLSGLTRKGEREFAVVGKKNDPRRIVACELIASAVVEQDEIRTQGFWKSSKQSLHSGDTSRFQELLQAFVVELGCSERGAQEQAERK
ncbi:MAG: hypothetical protein ACXVBC_01630 [Bdellovibrionota bacterium]